MEVEENAERKCFHGNTCLDMVKGKNLLKQWHKICQQKECTLYAIFIYLFCVKIKILQKRSEEAISAIFLIFHTVRYIVIIIFKETQVSCYGYPKLR